MRGSLLYGGLLTVLLIGAAHEAKAGSWCSFYDASTYNCGFNSYAQCLANISGVGGLCRQNFFEPRTYAPRVYYPRQRRHR